MRFDENSSLLEDFFAANEGKIRQLEDSLRNRVFTPLHRVSGSKKSHRRSPEALMECARIAEQLLKQVCSKHSIDFWLSFVRRFPHITGWNNAWVAHATLAIIKYSDWKKDTTFGHVQSDNQFGVVFAVPVEDFFECWKVALLSLLIAEILSARRWISKGARLIVKKSGSKPALSIPPEVRDAVQHYERRRPAGFTLHEEGVLIPLGDVLQRRTFSVLSHLRAPIPAYLSNQNMTVFMMNYFPKTIDPKPIAATLQAYEEALQDSVGVSTNVILQTLEAIWRLVWVSLPSSDDHSKLVFHWSLQDPLFDYQLRFLFYLCLRGYVRFPQDHLHSRLADVVVPPWSHSEEEARELVSAFFNAFVLTEHQRSTIDVLLLQPVPLLYTSPGEHCYFDFTAILDFVRWLIIRGREWYSSQHGDRFTLAIKRLIEKSTNASGCGTEKDVSVALWKTVGGRFARLFGRRALCNRV